MQLVQVFDSWAAELSPAAFKEFSQPYLAYISANLPKRLKELNLEPVPMVVFAKGAWYALDSLCDLGYQVVGLDWLQDPAEAVKIRGNRPIVFQGNADPGVLYGSREAITSVVTDMVKGFGGGKQGWIANLGHGEFYWYEDPLIQLIFNRNHSICQPRRLEVLLRGDPSINY
jgi:uroporphyrinogen decarboxylase